MILKPVCVACRCFLRPEKNGYAFIEGMPKGSDGLMLDPQGRVIIDENHKPENIRGNRAPEAWKPYKLWRGDLWKCPDCDYELVVGVIAGPVREHYQTDFNEWVAVLGGEQLQVNDC